MKEEGRNQSHFGQGAYFEIGVRKENEWMRLLGEVFALKNKAQFWTAWKTVKDARSFEAVQSVKISK